MTRYVLLARKQKKSLVTKKAELNINDEAAFMSNQSVNQYAKVRDKCYDIIRPYSSS